VSSISLKLGYKYLRSNKGGNLSFTTILAIIGLMIGISSLIVVTSVMNGFEKELEDRILGVIPHAIITSDTPINDYEDLIIDIKSNKDVIDASPYISIQGLVTSSYETSGISIVGIEPNIEKNMSIVPDYMMIGDIKNLKKENSIIIGSTLAASIGAYVGDIINITTSEIKTSIIGSYPRSVNLEVVGIFELKTETLSIRIKTNNLFNADGISEDILKDINNINYSYSSWKNSHGTLFEAIKFEKLLISLMLFLIVAVASILVLSTVVMTVKSKEREIGILLTLGANNKQIILIFFVQGLLVSLIGIIVGIILGLILILNLNNFVSFIEYLLGRNLLEAYFINYFPHHINIVQIITICFISFVISLIASLIPSFRAVKLNPVEILRHE
jgi:lipoprotein-releasing system permease protein